jgi:DNA-binding response OmpR family regulator
MPATILVVDDEPDMLELVAYALRLAGYDVLTAANGADALKGAQNRLPDLILLDLMLPDLDGLSVCELLHRLPSTSTIPVLVLTAMSGEELPTRVAQAGAVDCVRKPFQPRDLVLRIHQALAAAEAQRQAALEDPSDGMEATPGDRPSLSSPATARPWWP